MRRHRFAIQTALLIGGLALGVLLLPGCGSAPDPWEGQAGPPRVVTSFAPLACFARNVAGSDAGVLCLLHTVGPHDYKATPQDALILRRADLFLANGLGLDENFCKQLARSAANPNLRFIEVAESAKLDLLATAGEGFGGHSHGAMDPHVWLGIGEAKKQVERIRELLREIDPARAAGYNQRAAAYLGRLDALGEYGRQKLANVPKEKRRFVAFHDSLRYFARSFDLDFVGCVQPRAGSEPNAAEIADLTRRCIEQKVRVIAVEPQYPENTGAKTLLDELVRRGVTGARFARVNPLETATPTELAELDWYEREMRRNLDELAEALP